MYIYIYDISEFPKSSTIFTEILFKSKGKNGRINLEIFFDLHTTFYGKKSASWIAIDNRDVDELVLVVIN